ncbi:hypothetical protein GQ457_07G000080 [Hibiscus cannabinus]
MYSEIHTHKSHVMYFFEEPSLQLEVKKNRSKDGEAIKRTKTLRSQNWFYARNDQPGRIESQQYFEVVLKQLGSQRPRNHHGRASAQIFQPRPMDKIQEGILISSAGDPPNWPRVFSRLNITGFSSKCSASNSGMVTTGFNPSKSSARDRARAWLSGVPTSSLELWADLCRSFLMRYNPPNMHTQLRNDIAYFRQADDESMCECWDHYVGLLRKCTNHGFQDWTHVVMFYNGVNAPTRMMLDASTNGTLLDKSPEEAFETLDRIANNDYQFPTSRLVSGRWTSEKLEIDANDSISAQLSTITNLLKNFRKLSDVREAKALSCVHCEGNHHATGCTVMHEQTSYMRNFNRNSNNPYSNTYNPGSNPTELVEFDPEIEASARRAQGQLRREKKKRREQSNSERTTDSTNEESTDSTNHPNDPAPPIEIPRAPMAEQTIRQLAAAPTIQQPLCITFPQGDTPFQLKTGLIHLLPTFHGLPSESPHKHLSEFHLVCSSMKPQGVSEDQIKLRAFPFSLSGIAKEWLFNLPPNSITWTDLNNKFLDRFFPAAKASEIRRSILGIKQKYEETLHEYWERYKKLCASCPQHGLSEQTLVQYFYEGLLPTEMKIIDAASGGALCNMTPTQAKDLISTMAANSQQFGTISEPNQRVHEVSIVSLEKKFEQFTDMIASIALTLRSGKEINKEDKFGEKSMEDPTPSHMPSHMQKEHEFLYDSPIKEDKGEKLDNEKTQEQQMLQHQLHHNHVNLMPKAVFKKIGIWIKIPTTVILQLADQSHVRPEGKVEDVIVKIKDFEKLKKEDAEELDETPFEMHQHAPSLELKPLPPHLKYVLEYAQRPIMR